MSVIPPVNRERSGGAEGRCFSSRKLKERAEMKEEEEEEGGLEGAAVASLVSECWLSTAHP